MRSGIGGITGDGHDMHRPVWVKLSLVFPRRPDAPMPATLPDPRAVDTTAEVPGDLLAWLRTRGGEWLGLVTYQLPFADERHQRIYLERQLLPAYALAHGSTARTGSERLFAFPPSGLKIVHCERSDNSPGVVIK